MNRTRFSTLAMVSAAAAVLGAASWVGAAGLVPGVVISPDRATVLAMNPDGGLAAVSTATGQVRWTSAAADRPLLAVDGTVLAHVERFDLGQLSLAALDLADGSVLGTADVAIAPGVRARVADGLGESFGLGVVDAGGQRYLTWQYRSRKVQGIAPAEDAGQQLQVMEGAYRVDPVNVTAVAVDRSDVPPVGGPTAPAAFLQLLTDDRLAVEPVLAGDVWAAVAVRPGPADSSRLVLRRWDVADQSERDEVVLWTGDPIHVWTSADGDVAAVAARTHPGEWQEYTWSVFDLAAGTAAGELRTSVARTPYAVVAGGILVSTRPPAGRRVGDDWVELERRLVAHDLGTGAEAWTRAIRDLEFRGPFPP